MANIIFFGSLGDRVDQPEQTFDVTGDSNTARDIFKAISATNPMLVDAENNTPIKVALNQKLVSWDAIVSNGDELAFLPPVTGG